jgi:GntR family negative regulator for fad regulon and positive regulator of fabA
VLAPAYTRLAVQRDAASVFKLLEQADDLPDGRGDAELIHTQAEVELIGLRYAEFDWALHHALTVLSGNPIYTLILNGFSELYVPMGQRYFHAANARSSSRLFYSGLLAAAQAGDAVTAEAITRRVMSASLALWNQVLETEQTGSKSTPPGLER